MNHNFIRLSTKNYKKWKQMQQPEWAYLKFPQINFQDVIYYSAQNLKKN
jgi:Fe-S cluster assembly protein SufB